MMGYKYKGKTIVKVTKKDWMVWKDDSKRFKEPSIVHTKTLKEAKAEIDKLV